MKKAKFYTLGCKLNQAETAQVSGLWLSKGWARPIKEGDAPDVVFINTCAVTEKAAAKSRHALNRLQREHPGAIIIAAGCLAQYTPQAIVQQPGVHFILGTQDRFDTDWFNQDFSRAHYLVSSSFNKPLHLTHPSFKERARPFVKIQDGCDQGCSYCVIPRLRGSCRSVPASEILDYVQQLAGEGAAEIVLTGVRIGAWGQDQIDKDNLAWLLGKLIDATSIHRIRLGSLEPWELTEDIVSLVNGNLKICPHLHLPLQHTHPSVLQRMGRPPLSEDLERIYELAAYNPDLAVGVDIIVGFPGESEEEYASLVAQLDKLPLAYMHLFTFSPRPGTPAATFKSRVSLSQMKGRYAELREMDKLKRARFYQSQKGKIREVIPDHWRDGELWTRAIADNYLHLTVPTAAIIPGQPVLVRVGSGQRGEVV